MLPHSWKTDAQCVKSPKIFPQFSSSCSSTRDSRAASLDKAMSLRSTHSSSKEVSEPITPTDNLSQSNHCLDKKLTYFSLFNSKLLFIEQDCRSTDMSAELAEEANEAVQTAATTSDISDEEAKRILGKDLADMILFKTPTDSVSSFGQPVPKSTNGVR